MSQVRSPEQIAAAYGMIAAAVAAAIEAHGADAALAAIMRVVGLYREVLTAALLAQPPQGRA
jgi:hypothetical protein